MNGIKKWFGGNSGKAPPGRNPVAEQPVPQPGGAGTPPAAPTPAAPPPVLKPNQIALLPLVARAREAVSMALYEANPTDIYTRTIDAYKGPYDEAEPLFPIDIEELDAARYLSDSALDKARRQSPADPKALVAAYSKFFTVAHTVCSRLVGPPTVAAATQAAIPEETVPEPQAAPEPAPTPAPAVDPRRMLYDQLTAAGCKLEVVKEGTDIIDAVNDGKVKTTDAKGRAYTPSSKKNFENWARIQLGLKDQITDSTLKDLVSVYDDMLDQGYRVFAEEGTTELKQAMDAYETVSRIVVKAKDDTKWYVRGAARVAELGRIRLNRLGELDPKVKKEFEILSQLSTQGMTFSSSKGGNTTKSPTLARWRLEDEGEIMITYTNGKKVPVKRTELQKLAGG